MLMTITAFLVACVGTPEVPAAPSRLDPATVKAGEALFFQCVACHTVARNDAQLVGPNLWGVFGAKAGRRPGFAYSGALKESNITWTDETMAKWLESPSTFIPNNTMAAVGVTKKEDQDALIAYLKAATVEY